MGSPSSGVDPAWAAGRGEPGVALIESLSDVWVERIKQAIDGRRQPGDVGVVSVHWGPNWGYRIPGSHRRFARTLVDQAGVDVVHGHSSHHPVGLEIYQGHLILYGCGDLLTDYEGIQGHEVYRPELGGWYIGTFDHLSGELRSLRIVPTKVRRFQLSSPTEEELEWLASRFREHSLPRGLRVDVEDGHLSVEW
jgi:poly-gamma-glutamate capsule biosynthesis protein CapA/YwtB (metallophosphatase superfamily)